MWKSFGLPLVYRALNREPEAQHSLAALIANSAGHEFQVAENYAYFGEPDQAFHWLEEALAPRSGHPPHARGYAVPDSGHRSALSGVAGKMKLPDELTRGVSKHRPRMTRKAAVRTGSGESIGLIGSRL